jgi:uncharacterized Ntn-hydrolase superfamily protein
MTEQQRIKQRAYRAANAERVKANRKRYMDENKDMINQKKKLWREANPDTVKQMNKLSHIKRRDKTNEYQNIKYKNNPTFRLRKKMANAIGKAFKRNGYPKSSTTELILGCSYNDFKEYIESKFESWMNWNNYGLYNGTERYVWDIDHIIPIASAMTENEIIQLNHYTNLQPLCSKLNRDIKRDNF